MKKESLSISMSKLTTIVVLTMGIGAIFGASEHILVKSKILIQPVVAQEKTLDKNSISEWGHEEMPENISVDSQLNIKNIVFECGVIIYILISVYGIIQFILAIKEKMREEDIGLKK